MAWQPTWQVLIAFNNGAQDDPGLITTVATPAGTLGANNVWTDVTPWLYGTSLDTTRGRQHEVDKMVAGRLIFTLLNTDGRFDSWNTSGPYTGKLVPGVPVRLQATFSGTTYKVYTGTADVWSTQWPAPNTALKTVQCVDQFSYFNYAYCQSSLYPKQVIADGATHYWRLGEPVGSITAFDTAGTDNGSVHDTVIFGTAGAIPINLGTSAQFGTGTTNDGSIALPTPISLGTTYSIEAWVNWTSGASGGGKVFETWDSTVQLNAELIVNSDGAGAVRMQQVDGGGTQTTTTNTGVSAGAWHHIVATVNAATATIYVDGVAAATTVIGSCSGSAITGAFSMIAAAAQNITGGNVDFFGGLLQEVAIYPSVLSAAQVLNHYNLAVGVGVESSGSRVGRMLDWIGWPTAARTLDTGTSQVQGISASLTTTTVLSYLQLLEQTEYGVLFMTVDGKVRFMSRGTLLSENQITGSVATFGDGGGSEIPFELNHQQALDTLDLYARVQVTRAGGIAQVAGANQGRTLSISGTLQTTDAECLGYAQWVSGQLGTASERIRSITIHPVVDQTGTATTTILGLELMQIVTVNRHTLPGAGTLFSQVAFVEGINHHVDPSTGDWTVTLQLTPVNQAVWVLGVSKLGVDTRLAF